MSRCPPGHFLSVQAQGYARIARGEAIAFGGYEVRPHHTPGHCPGGVCLQIGAKGEAGKELFVGDTLFAGSIGRTDLPGGDFDVLIASIRNVLFAFGDEAIVHPGHGPDTTIGQERRTNPFLHTARLKAWHCIGAPIAVEPVVDAAPVRHCPVHGQLHATDAKAIAGGQRGLLERACR